MKKNMHRRTFEEIFRWNSQINPFNTTRVPGDIYEEVPKKIRIHVWFFEKKNLQYFWGNSSNIHEGMFRRNSWRNPWRETRENFLANARWDSKRIYCKTLGEFLEKTFNRVPGRFSWKKEKLQVLTKYLEQFPIEFL